MRGLRVLGLVVALALVTAACGDDDAASTTAPADLTTTPGVLSVGSDIPYEPFEYFDDAGNVLGFDADLITEIAERLGLTVEWTDTDFDTIFTQLSTGTYDVVISASTITAERALVVNFSDPYYKSQQSLAVNTTLTPDIDSPDDLGEGDAVAVQTGTTGADWAAANLAPNGVEVREFAVIIDAYIALEAGQVTGVINDEPSALAEVANREGLEVVALIDTGEDYGIAVDPARTALLDAINEALADMVDDGTYQTIYDTWFDNPGGSVLYIPPEAENVGTPERPIRLVIAPLVPAELLLEGVEIMIFALESDTGLEFEALVPDTYAETVAAFCASPQGTMGILPAEVLYLVEQDCGATARLRAVRFGYPDYWTEIVVPRDSGIVSLADLDGSSWALPGEGSTSGDLFARAMFALAGIEPGSLLQAGGHTEAVRAVYVGEADFASVRFSPNLDLEGNTVWDGTAAGADIPADLLESCELTADGDLVCGGLRPRDARRGLRDEFPDVIQKVAILALSPAIPNELIAFASGFPSPLEAEVVEAILTWVSLDPEGFFTAFEPLVWDALAETDEADLVGMRTLLDALEFTAGML